MNGIRRFFAVSSRSVRRASMIKEKTPRERQGHGSRASWEALIASCRTRKETCPSCRLSSEEEQVTKKHRAGRNASAVHRETAFDYALPGVEHNWGERWESATCRYVSDSGGGAVTTCRCAMYTCTRRETAIVSVPGARNNTCVASVRKLGMFVCAFEHDCSIMKLLALAGKMSL